MKTKLFLIAVLLLGAMYGCNELFNDNDDSKAGTGSVTISLTDAPFPMELVEEANVTIDWVKLRPVDAEDESEEDTEEDTEGSESTEGEGEEGEEDSEWIVLEVDATFNLLELVNGETTILGVIPELPAGEYDEIRMHVVESNIVLVDDGGEFDLKIPSGNSSGLKIKIKPSLIIEEGTDAEILLDFDASRSFKVKGNWDKGKINGFMFKPVIRAANLTSTGSVYGNVTDAETSENIKNAHLYLISGTAPDLDTLASAKTTEEGYYKIIGIPAGDYTLSCEKEDEYTTVDESVSIVEGEELEVLFSLSKVAESTE